MKTIKAFLYRFRFFLIVVVLFLLIGVNLTQSDAKENPYYSMEISSKPLSRTSIQIKWKKNGSNIKSVSKFKIYRYSGEKEDRTMKDYKLIATVSGKTFSYTDKKLKEGKRYVYIVRAYKSVKGKQKLIGETVEEENVTGPGQVQWFEYQRSDTDFSTKQIELSFYVPNGIKPTGYQIYRRVSGGKYQLIKTIKSSKQSGWDEISYVDKTVKAGQTYYYKVRAYKKTGSKTYYGKKSEAVKMSAVNYNGKFTSDIMEENTSEGTVTLCMTSDKYNGTLCLEPNLLSLYLEDSEEKGIPDVKLEAWSLDGKTWNKDKKKVNLSAGKKIYLIFRSENEVKLSKEYLTGRSIYCEDVSYNDLPAILQFECSGTGYAGYNMEYIH